MADVELVVGKCSGRQVGMADGRNGMGMADVVLVVGKCSGWQVV